MKKNWEKNKQEFEESKAFRRLLSEMLVDKIRVKHSEMREKAKYEIAHWPYFQADGMGYDRALNEILSLLED